MRVILTGATGLVGSAVLDAMIKNKDITKISILSRKPVKMAEDAKDPRVSVILHQDFETYDAQVLSHLQGANACVWALGTSQNNVPDKETYTKITKDYALAAARAFSALPASSGAGDDGPFRFIYVSGEGATQTPGYFSALFARVKGEAEKELSELAAVTPSLRVDSVRLGFVDARRHDAILPYIPGLGLAQRAAIPAFALLVKLVPDLHAPTQMMGNFFTKLAMGRLDDRIEGPGSVKLGPSWIMNNAALRRVMRAGGAEGMEGASRGHVHVC